MSFVLTAFNAGFSSVFIRAWMGSFALGTAVALPVSLLVLPFVRKLIDPLFAKDE